MLTTFYKSKLGLAAEIFALTIFPLILLKFFPEWIHSRTAVMFGGLSYVLIFVWTQKIKSKNLGLRISNFLPAAKDIFRPTLLAITLTFILFYGWRELISVPLLIGEINQLPSATVLALRYLFISAPIQEMLYRAYLINRVEFISRNKWFIQGYSAIIFMLIHTPIRNFFLTGGTLILGWIWAGHFLKYRNIFSVILSHGLIGLVYVFLMVQ